MEAINQKRTIAFINHFVTHTARFLNHFSCVCEDKLEHLSSRLQQLEISLSVVEAKVFSSVYIYIYILYLKREALVEKRIIVHEMSANDYSPSHK